ncbi:MAG: AAA family ATPase [Betaproteobacteria bacterium]|nr:AAA family ATPase [Betaproteobacteria bacterium]
MADVPGTIVSFYSYKGGVGRTMSVVNVAMTLAENGFRVLVVDLDLLAPGVQDYPLFHEAVESSIKYVSPKKRELGVGGMLDLVERQICSSLKKKERPFQDPFVPAKGDPITWQKWKRRVYEHRTPDGFVDVLPAGPATHQAVEILAHVGWYKFLTKHGGMELILSMRDRWWRKEYDFTLIDSRTGLSDYLRFCVGMLPDVAVVIAGLNEQNLDGLNAALQGVEEVLPYREIDLNVIPVLSLIPSAELDLVGDRFLHAEKLLKDIRTRADAIGGEQRTLRILGEPVRLPYVATLAVAERLVVPSDPDAAIFRPYVRIAEMLARHKFAAIDNLIDEAIYEGSAAGLDNERVSGLIKEAQVMSANAFYVYGSIHCQKLEGQRLTYAQLPDGVKYFEEARKLIRKRRGLEPDEPWDKADASIGHWKIELEALVFYARVLAADKARSKAIDAFRDAIDFATRFEKRNHADMFTDRDWDRYSHEMLFTKAFCELGRLELQIHVVENDGMVKTPALKDNLEKTRRLFQQLAPHGISSDLKKRLEDCDQAVSQLER